MAAACQVNSTAVIIETRSTSAPLGNAESSDTQPLRKTAFTGQRPVSGAPPPLPDGLASMT